MELVTFAIQLTGRSVARRGADGLTLPLAAKILQRAGARALGEKNPEGRK